MASDERLDAGRHHLDNGIRALRQGFLDESRSHFEAALLQFRGPELRLGEAHALRGLGEVEAHSGNLGQAEGAIRRAVGEYQEVRNDLDRVDPDHVSAELGRDAEEGEAAALVLLGEVLLRAGRAEEARRTLGAAHQLYAGMGEDVPSAAGVYLNLARLGLREGRTDEASAAADKAVALLARFGDKIGECGAWLVAAETRRLGGRLDEAAQALETARVRADESRQTAMQGRVRSQQASLFAQQNRLEEAGAAYDEALARIREAGDVEMEAYALLGRGDVRSRNRDAGAIYDLVDATRLLGQLENRHGLGAAMLRLSEHALRIGMPVYALAAAESARQVWQVTDPGRGVGQAQRLEVKALAALRKWPAAVTVAHARAALVGALQRNAIEVRDFYRERAPVGLLSDLDLLDDAQLELRAESMVEALLEPMLRQLDLDFQSLGLPGGALAVVSALAKATPMPSPVRATPAPAPRAEAPPAIEQAPPEEAAADRGDYEGLYVPPAPPTGEEPTVGQAAGEEPTAPGSAADAGTEPDEDTVVAQLQSAPLPADYAGLYEPPRKGDHLS